MIFFLNYLLYLLNVHFYHRDKIDNGTYVVNKVKLVV